MAHKKSRFDHRAEYCEYEMSAGEKATVGQKKRQRKRTGHGRKITRYE